MEKSEKEKAEKATETVIGVFMKRVGRERIHGKYVMKHDGSIEEREG